MGTVKIEYTNLDLAISAASAAASKYDSYIDKISTKVVANITSLPGQDGPTMPTVRTTVQSKISEFTDKSTRFNSLSESLDTLRTSIKNHDEKVEINIYAKAMEAFELKDQGIFKKACQFIYGVFIDNVNSTPLGEVIGTFLMKTCDSLQSKVMKTIDWFKHGEGRYWLNIGMSVVGVALSLAAVFGAAALVVASGGTAAPAIVCLVATCLGTVMTYFDSFACMHENSEAITLLRQTDDPGRARFYGDISGVSDEISKTNFGNKTTNEVMDAVGLTYDITHIVADIVAFVTGGIAKAGLTETIVRDSAGKIVGREYVYDSSAVKGNLKASFLEHVGLENKNGDWSFNVKRLFKSGKTGTNAKSSMVVKHAEKDLIKTKMGLGDKGYKAYKTVKKVFKTESNVVKTTKSIEKIADGEDVARNVIKVADKVGINVASVGKALDDTVGKLYDLVTSSVA